MIVVTHNFEQFEAYATRKIKMHDGKVVEDEILRKSVRRRGSAEENRSLSFAGAERKATGKISAAQQAAAGAAQYVQHPAEIRAAADRVSVCGSWRCAAEYTIVPATVTRKTRKAGL